MPWVRFTARSEALDLSDWAQIAARYPLLTPAEELTLGRAVRTWQDHPDGPDGCPPAIRRRGLRARDRLVTGNLRLVVSYLQKRAMFSRMGETADRLQDGAVGLQRAAEKFDPARGYKFSTYAYWWIRQAITRAKETETLIRISEKAQQSPIAETVAAAENARRGCVSLDAPIRGCAVNGGESPLAEHLAGGSLSIDDAAEVEVWEQALAACRGASADDLALLELQHEGHNVRELGRLFGVASASLRVCQARARLRALPEVEIALAG